LNSKCDILIYICLESCVVLILEFFQCMPVTKVPKSSRSIKKSSHDCCFDGQCGYGVLKKEAIGDFGGKIIWTLVAVVLVYSVFFLGTVTQKNIKELRYIGQADRNEHTLTVSADAKVPVRPDIAETSIGMMAEGETVAEAQEKNTRVMNALIERLKGLGIAADDIQTANYNVYPRYDYIQDEGQVLRGYQVNQEVRVKIREISKANQVLALAGELGANTVSGLQFTIDDKDIYLAQAREQALQKANKKAQSLSQMLGVKLVSIVNYDEYQTDGGGPIQFRAESIGFGGAAEAPNVEPGSEEVQLEVRVTFEIR